MDYYERKAKGYIREALVLAQEMVRQDAIKASGNPYASIQPIEFKHEYLNELTDKTYNELKGLL